MESDEIMEKVEIKIGFSTSENSFQDAFNSKNFIPEPESSQGPLALKIPLPFFLNQHNLEKSSKYLSNHPFQQHLQRELQNTNLAAFEKSSFTNPSMNSWIQNSIPLQFQNFKSSPLFPQNRLISQPSNTIFIKENTCLKEDPSLPTLTPSLNPDVIVKTKSEPDQTW